MSKVTLDIQRNSFKSLKAKCKAVEFNDPIRLQKLGVALMNLLARDKSYHTLSANQCGLEEQIFVCRVNSTYTAYFNPTLIDIKRGELLHLVEGKETSQNFPTMSYTVRRPTEIRIGFQDYMGNKRMTWMYNLPARFWLIGYDYVNGLTPYDRQIDTTTKLEEEFQYNA